MVQTKRILDLPPPPPPDGLGCCPFKCGGSVVVDLLFIVTPIVGVCKCSLFCCTLLYVNSSFAIIFMGKRELVALLCLSSLLLFCGSSLTVPWVSLQCVIMVLTCFFLYSCIQEYEGHPIISDNGLISQKLLL